jgi:hypothetical protein
VSLEPDKERLESILRVITDLGRRLGDMDCRTFSGNREEIDLTAFRLSAIAENANKLSEGDQGAEPDPAVGGHVRVP